MLGTKPSRHGAPTTHELKSADLRVMPGESRAVDVVAVRCGSNVGFDRTHSGKYPLTRSIEQRILPITPALRSLTLVT